MHRQITLYQEVMPDKFQETINQLSNRQWMHIIVKKYDGVEVHSVYKDDEGNLYDSILETIKKIDNLASNPILKYVEGNYNCCNLGYCLLNGINKMKMGEISMNDEVFYNQVLDAMRRYFVLIKENKNG